MQQLKSWRSKSMDHRMVQSRANSKKKHFSKEQTPAFSAETFCKMVSHNKQVSAHSLMVFNRNKIEDKWDKKKRNTV